MTSSWTRSLRAWTVILIASTFFFFEFIQMNMLNSISASLMEALKIDATQLSDMSSYYFYANVIFLFFAGVLLDRYSIKRVILIALLVCIAGIVGFSLAQTYWTAVLFRFFTGIGSAFCFLSVIRLATRWFHDKHLALVTSVIVAMAMAGGIFAQTPFELLSQHLTWRHALIVDAALGVVVFIVIALFVKDYPPGVAKAVALEHKELQVLGYWQSLKMAFLRLQNWLGGIYTALMNLPLSILGGLWGVLYLQKVHHLSHLEADNVSIMLFAGTIIGGPVFGWFSDKIANRRQPMLIGAVISFFLILVIINSVSLSYFELAAVFLLLGITTSSQIIGYPIVAEGSLPVIIAMSVSVVNITVEGAQGVFQPFFGRLMDLEAHHTAHSLSWVYAAKDFHWAMWLFPAGFVIAFFSVLAMRETHAKQREDHIQIPAQQQ